MRKLDAETSDCISLLLTWPKSVRMHHALLTVSDFAVVAVAVAVAAAATTTNTTLWRCGYRLFTLQL